MKIANKITLSFLAISTIFTLIASGVFYLIAKSYLVTSIESNLELACDSRARHIETYLKMLKVSVQQLSKDVILGNLLDENRAGFVKNDTLNIALQRLNRTKQANPGISEFLLMDTTGKVIAATNQASIGSDKSNDAIFFGAHKETYIKDVYFSETLKQNLIAVSTPVIERRTNELIGVLAARVQLADLGNILIDRTGLGRTGEIYIVNKYGFMITPSRFIQDAPLRQKVDTPNFRECQLGKFNSKAEKRLIVGSDYRGAIVLGAHEYLSEMQWSILAEVDIGEAYAPLAKIRFLFLTIIFLVPLSTWIVGRYLSGMLSGPIRKLQTGVEIIGSGNLSYRVGTDVRDEVGELSREFDKMAWHLKATRDELADFAEDLEKKVRDRTKALTEAQEATLSILEDLTESKQKLEEALKVKSDFTSMVSHELRTPLTAIKEGIAIVLDGTAGAIGDEQKEFLEVAKRNVDRLARLINDILDFQKLEAGKIEFHRQENDINELVREVKKGMAPLAKQKGLDFTLRLDEAMPKIVFDHDRIFQVLTNLVNNAVKFTEKGSITIITGQSDNIVRVSVQDTGPGIAKEDIPRLFQRFGQLKAGVERKTGSSGLGLAISKDIIEHHQGKIWAESKPGEGVIFHFVLPIQERRKV